MIFDKFWLFPSETGTPIAVNNYLRRNLKPLAARLGIKGVTHQALRRTVGTNTQHHGEIKSTQGLLRYKDASTTLKHYQKTSPADVVAMARSWDAELMAIHCAACHKIDGGCRCRA